jgi:hypothetical protein
MGLRRSASLCLGIVLATATAGAALRDVIRRELVRQATKKLS